MMIDTSLAEMTVCAALLVTVTAPPLYAWVDKWLDAARDVKVDVTKSVLQGETTENKEEK